MKKQLILFLVFLATSFALHAQEPDWIWVRQLSGNSDDEFNDVATDADGNSYMSGYFNSGSVTFAGQTFAGSPGGTAILVKRNPSGGLVWAREISGCRALAVSTDASGNCSITGQIMSVTASASIGNIILNNTLGGDVFFIARYNANGDVLWAKTVAEGNLAGSEPRAIQCDAFGNSYVMGMYYGGQPANFGNGILPNEGVSDVFLLKYSAEGNLEWSKHLGGSSAEQAADIAVDAAGNVIVVGGYNSAVFSCDGLQLLNPSGLLPTGGRKEIFVVKYTAAGAIVWAKNAEGNGEDIAQGVSTDASGNIYVSGQFNSDSLNWNDEVVANTDNTPNSNTYSDIFVAKLNASGSAVWLKSYGSAFISGEYEDIAFGIQTTADGLSYVCGFFSGSEITFGSQTLSNIGFEDFFIMAMDSDGSELWAKSSGIENGSVYAYNVAFDAFGNVFVAGYFDADFGSLFNFGSISITGNSAGDGFMVKLGANTVDIPSGERKSLMQLFPNPSSGTVSIDLNTNQIQGNSILHVYDLLGKEVLSMSLNSLQYTCRIGAQIPDGIYIIKVLDSTGNLLGSDRLVLQR